jgi:hypothetical protein
MIGKTISQYRIFSQFGGGGMVWFTAGEIRSKMRKDLR